MSYEILGDKDLRIAISGKSGCGNTTVSSKVAQKLNITMINYTFRSLSEEIGLSLPQILEQAKNDDSFDRKVDTRQVELALQQSCVLGSRLAIWMLKDANLKVYLLADDDVRAKRIFNREGGNLDDIKSFTKMRDTEDTNRYKKLYNINNNDYQFCDLIIDTSKYNPDEIVNIIIKELIKRKLVVER